MPRRWWPESLYEVRPYLAFALGILATAVSLARAWAVGHWELPVVCLAGAGCAALVYGAAILETRRDYRRRSRWKRENPS